METAELYKSCGLPCKIIDKTKHTITCEYPDKQIGIYTMRKHKITDYGYSDRFSQ